jgi:hypothetical protein
MMTCAIGKHSVEIAITVEISQEDMPSPGRLEHLTTPGK